MQFERARAGGLDGVEDEANFAGGGVEVDAAFHEDLLADCRCEAGAFGCTGEHDAVDDAGAIFEIKVPVRAVAKAGDFACDAQGIGQALLERGVDAGGELRDGERSRSRRRGLDARGEVGGIEGEPVGHGRVY